MIIGDCPYPDCQGRRMIPCARECPTFSKETCETCGRGFWLRHSRVDPKAHTEQDFHEEYEVDYEIGRITKRESRHADNH